MSSLWTPEGEHRVGPGGTAAAGSEPSRPAGTSPSDAPGGSAGEGPPTDDEAMAQLAELRHQLLATPVEVVVANHAYGLFELAALHLSERPPNFAQARLAIDALGALVEGLSGRLGDAEPSLVDAVSQLRLAFVQLQGAPGSPGDGAPPPGDGQPAG